MVLGRLVGALAVTLFVAAAPVYAVSIRDIVQLSRAGLSDEIIIALIETDKTVFTLSTEQIVDLKRAGVSDRVIVTMLQQGRRPEPPAPPIPEPDYIPPAYDPPPTYAPPAPSTTVVVMPAPVFYPYPVFIPQRPLRHVKCTPGRIIGRTEKITTPIPGRWVANGRTGGMVYMSDPVCE